MIGFYYTDTRRRNKLFIPYVLIAEQTGEDFEVDFNPNKISDPRKYLKRNQVSLNRGLQSIVDIPLIWIKKIVQYCFQERRYEARSTAINLMKYVSGHLDDLSVDSSPWDDAWLDGKENTEYEIEIPDADDWWKYQKSPPEWNPEKDSDDEGDEFA